MEVSLTRRLPTPGPRRWPGGNCGKPVHHLGGGCPSIRAGQLARSGDGPGRPCFGQFGSRCPGRPEIFVIGDTATHREETARPFRASPGAQQQGAYVAVGKFEQANRRRDIIERSAIEMSDHSPRSVGSRPWRGSAGSVSQRAI